MALCPECLSVKPFFALRCHACNEDIGLLRQTFAMYVYWGTQIFFLWWIFALFTGGATAVVLWWLAFIIIPLALVFGIRFVTALVFG